MILKKETLIEEQGTQKPWSTNGKDMPFKEEDHDLSLTFLQWAQEHFTKLSQWDFRTSLDYWLLWMAVFIIVVLFLFHHHMLDLCWVTQGRLDYHFPSSTSPDQEEPHLICFRQWKVSDVTHATSKQKFYLQLHWPLVFPFSKRTGVFHIRFASSGKVLEWKDMEQNWTESSRLEQTAIAEV